MLHMDLIIFDIDGTLLHTTAVDDSCFVRAAADVFGVQDVSSDWSIYDHCTDVAIASQIVRERLGRDCTDADIAAFRARFVELLKQEQQRDANLFQEVPGAGQFIRHLRECGIAACLATGGFEQSARFKLRSASLDCHDLPAAFAEDGPSREEVVTAAMSRAARLASEKPPSAAMFRRPVSFGDGVWDVRTAASLGVPFIGIATGARAAQLREAGAEIILSDYADLNRVLDAISRAGVPQTVV